LEPIVEPETAVEISFTIEPPGIELTAESIPQPTKSVGPFNQEEADLSEEATLIK